MPIPASSARTSLRYGPRWVEESEPIGMIDCAVYGFDWCQERMVMRQLEHADRKCVLPKKVGLWGVHPNGRVRGKWGILVVEWKREDRDRETQTGQGSDWSG